MLFEAEEIASVDKPKKKKSSPVPPALSRKSLFWLCDTSVFGMSLYSHGVGHRINLRD